MSVGANRRILLGAVGVLVLVLASTARAGTVTAPLGWSADSAMAVSLSQQLGAVAHFGGLRSVVTTEVYRTPGASLVVTRVAANAPAAEHDRAATAELGEVDAGMRRAGSNGRSESGEQREDTVAKQLTASRVWRDAETGVRTTAQMVVVGDGQQLVAVHGECVFAEDASQAAVAACSKALQSLDPGIAVAARVPLRLDASTRTPPPASPPVDSKQLSSGPSLVDSGPRPALPPMEIPQNKREADRRPIYVGLGLIVLAVIFYWNRKNREKLEREYEHRTATKPAEPAESEPVADRDADDLHAAAEQPPKDDTKVDKA